MGCVNILGKITWLCEPMFFPNNQCLMLESHANKKILSKWKTDQWIYNLTEYVNFIEVVLDPILQLTFKKLQLGKFWYSINRNIHSYLKRILKYSSSSN